MIHIPQSEYARRRQALMDRMEPDSIAILPAAPVHVRNRDVEYAFRQDSDFQYLTGFPEPEAVMALIPGREHGQYILFCRERDPAWEQWDGLRAGQEGALRDYGADDAFPISDIDEILPGLIEGRERVYYSIGANAEFDQRLMDWINVIRSKSRQGAQPPGEFFALGHLLHEMRLFKSAAEMKVIRYAAQVSAGAHMQAMRASKPGLHEYDLEAELEYCFRKGGARLVAYGSIVASGNNACILHYQNNDAELKDGDLVMIDAGCEIDCYASDISRTFPVNGRFTPEQRAIYEIVLEANLEAIKLVGPGHTWNEPHDKTVEVITAGLLRLGILKGELNQLIEEGAYRPFYMHRAGHWLGLDTHDVGDYKIAGQWRLLEPGMLLTIEPGIYISKDMTDVDEKWRGIGIRIEDNLVVTRNGHQITTSGVPKTIEEIEALMAEGACHAA